ncbi:MAG: AEC family transporter [Gammaproteobacteria bacterium]|jgi:predicted permease
MFEVLMQMGGLILCGVGWRLFRPAGLAPGETRRVLTSLVYYLLLPALVLSVLWKAELGSTSLLIALSAATGVLSGLLLSAWSCRFCGVRPAAAGAVILAAGFPNATYLGLPVLEAAFGPWARSVAIQYDLFACTPLLFTLGVMTAARYGAAQAGLRSTATDLLRIPALWAAAAAATLNLAEVPVPVIADGLLGLLERGVVPLMLFSLGLSLEWNGAQWRNLAGVIPVALLRLLLVPALIMVFTGLIGLSGPWRAAVVMETAMPSMVLGIVFCDRFNLDVGLYATAVTTTTVLSLLTLPLWYRGLMG